MKTDLGWLSYSDSYDALVSWNALAKPQLRWVTQKSKSLYGWLKTRFLLISRCQVLNVRPIEPYRASLHIFFPSHHTWSQEIAVKSSMIAHLSEPGGRSGRDHHVPMQPVANQTASKNVKPEWEQDNPSLCPCAKSELSRSWNRHRGCATL